MIFLLSLIIPIIAFFFEIYPRLENRLFGVDIWTHLLYLQEYHKQNGIPKKIENGFLITGDYDYPPAFIYILSKFSIDLVKNYEFLFSPFFDSLHIILIYFIVYSLTQNIGIALLTQLFYMLTPIIVLENSSATPRSLGYSLFTIVFISLFLFSFSHIYIYLFLAIVCGAFIFLSHRFTTQGYLFLAILFSIYEKNVLYVGAFCVSFILAIIISKGFYLKVLQGHIGNLLFWQKNIAYRFAHQVKGNYSEYKTQDFVFRIYNQFLKFPPFVLIITNPWLLSAGSNYFFSFPPDQISNNLILWALFSFLLSLMTTWVPQLRFLGEGKRYLELSAFPVAFLSAIAFSYLLKTRYSFLASVLYILIGLLAALTIIVIQRKAIVKDTLRSIPPGLEKLFVYLQSLKIKPKLLCIPHQMTTSIIYHTGCTVFVNADYAHIEKISDVYPYIKKPLPEIMEKYDLDLILLNEAYAKIEDLQLKNYQVVKKIDTFLLIKLVSSHPRRVEDLSKC